MKCHTINVVGKMMRKIAVALDQRTVSDLDQWFGKAGIRTEAERCNLPVNLLEERESPESPYA